MAHRESQEYGDNSCTLKMIEVNKKRKQSHCACV